MKLIDTKTLCNYLDFMGGRQAEDEGIMTGVCSIEWFCQMKDYNQLCFDRLTYAIAVTAKLNGVYYEIENKNPAV